MVKKNNWSYKYIIEEDLTIKNIVEIKIKYTLNMLKLKCRNEIFMKDFVEDLEKLRWLFVTWNWEIEFGDDFLVSNIYLTWTLMIDVHSKILILQNIIN